MTDEQTRPENDGAQTSSVCNVWSRKLISPLAIRFTQQHIKTTFRDGSLVEDVVAEIHSQPGVGGYDSVLAAPFPPIQIIRWCPLFADQVSRESSDHCDHWFSLDNRRLYCLQRAATDHWPHKVAAEVIVLFADPGIINKKYDSATRGHEVSIANSSKEVPIGMWNWCKQLNLSTYPPRDEHSSCQICPTTAMVLADDAKATVDFLLDPSGSVPDAPVFVAVDGQASSKQETTFVVTGVPEAADQNVLLGLWPQSEWRFDMLYLPYQVQDRKHKGYVFLNFPSKALAERFRATWEGYKLRGGEFEISMSEAHVQGLNANIQRFLARRTRNLRNRKFQPVVFTANGRVPWENFVRSASS